jgi:hypothetical protein
MTMTSRKNTEPRLKSLWQVGGVIAAMWLLFPIRAEAGEFGLAVTSMDYGPYDDPTDCPAGLAQNPAQIYLASLPPAKRKEFEDRDKRVGALAAYLTTVLSQRRSANGHDTCEDPTAFKDPAMPIGQSKTSFGMDLDGGDRTTHCDHQEFLGANGQTGIDNQVARLTACIKSVRKEDNRRNQATDAGLKMGNEITLIRVSNVTDMENSDNVTVDIYKSRDGFMTDGTGTPLPDATMKAAENEAVFHATTHGRIVKGVLITDPVDAHIMENPSDAFIRGARFQIDIHPDGHANGILAGYYDNHSFWDSWARNSGLQIPNGYSCPALYERLNELADGYKDPATGKCTAISAAFNITAVRAFVVPPKTPDSM